MEMVYMIVISPKAEVNKALGADRVRKTRMALDYNIQQFFGE
jgi:hypothetical protein